MHDTALEGVTCIFWLFFDQRSKHDRHTHSHLGTSWPDVWLCSTPPGTGGKKISFANHLRFCFNSRVYWFWRRIVCDRHWRDGFGERWASRAYVVGCKTGWAGHARADTGQVFWASIGIVEGRSERKAHDSCLWFGKRYGRFRSGARVEPSCFGYSIATVPTHLDSSGARQI